MDATVQLPQRRADLDVRAVRTFGEASNEADCPMIVTLLLLHRIVLGEELEEKDLAGLKYHRTIFKFDGTPS